MVKKYRLPKFLLIKKNVEFTEILHQGKHLSSSFFLLSFLPNDTLKVGFTCTRSQSSVQRNHLKRLAKELARTCDRLWTLNIRLIIMIKESARRTSFQILQTDFQKLINKVAEITTA